MNTASRRSLSIWLALASGGVVLGTAAGAWATFDFWETIPLVPCLVAAGLFAAAAVYVRKRHSVVAVAVGFAVGSGTLLAALMITLARWEG